MDNSEILDSWDKCHNISDLDLSNFYSVMFIDEGETVDDFLSLFQLHKNDLGDDEFVNSKLLEVDELFKSTNELFEKFIKERLVTDCDDDELMDSILELKVRLYENYDGVRDCMNEIKWEVGQYWDD